MAPLFLAACGHQPAAALVTVGGRHFHPTVNGYRVSGDVGDAAFDPAHGLKRHTVTTGAKIRLSFIGMPPNRMTLTTWSQGKKQSMHVLNGETFQAPKMPGDYTYEVHAQWGKFYANYDFALRVR